MTSRKLIKEALASGLEPITILKRNVYSCSGNPDPIAYRTELVVNSTVVGTLTPDQYQVTADQSERGILLADKALSWVCEAIEEKLKNGEKFLWISLYCPVKMLTGTDLLQKLGEIFDGDKSKRSKICLEFPANSLFEDPAVMRTALLDLKVLGVRSALSGYGGEYCPMMRLATFPFDYVILDPAVNGLTFSESGAKAVETLVSYARSLRVEVLASGLEGEQQLAAYYRLDCSGCTKNEPADRLLPLVEFEPDPSAVDDAPASADTTPEAKEDASGEEKEDPEAIKETPAEPEDIPDNTEETPAEPEDTPESAEETPAKRETPAGADGDGDGPAGTGPVADLPDDETVE